MSHDKFAFYKQLMWIGNMRPLALKITP